MNSNFSNFPPSGAYTHTTRRALKLEGLGSYRDNIRACDIAVSQQFHANRKVRVVRSMEFTKCSANATASSHFAAGANTGSVLW